MVLKEGVGRRPRLGGGSIYFKIRLFFTQRVQLVGELSMLRQEHYKLKQHVLEIFMIRRRTIPESKQ